MEQSQRGHQYRHEGTDMINMVNVSQRVQWVELNVFDFGQDLKDLNGTQQCFSIEMGIPKEICLEYDDAMMSMDIIPPSDWEMQHFEFDTDEHWNEVNRIATR